MFMACRHIKTNGLRCESPALKGGQFCYYHSKTHTLGAEGKFGPLQLPPPEDSAAIQLSVARINDAILTGRLDLKMAAALFTGLKIVSRFIDPTSSIDETDIVQSAEPTIEGELAPREFICSDDEYCDDCPYTELCPRCIDADDNASEENEEEEDEEEDYDDEEEDDDDAEDDDEQDDDEEEDDDVEEDDDE